MACSAFIFSSSALKFFLFFDLTISLSATRTLFSSEVRKPCRVGGFM